MVPSSEMNRSSPNWAASASGVFPVGCEGRRLKRSHRSLIAAVLFLSLPAAAADVPRRLVSQISVLQATEQQQKEAEALLDEVVSELDSAFVSSAEAARDASSTPCYASAEIDACLAEIARGAQADGTLFIVASLHSPQIALTGRIVSASGAATKEPSTRLFPNAPAAQRRAALRRALRSYIREELGLQDLIEPLAEVPLIPPEPPPDSATPNGSGPIDERLAPRNTRPLRIVSYGLAGAGTLALAGATVIVLAAGDDRRRLAEQLDDLGRISDGDGDAFDRHRSLTARGRAATVLACTGVAALAAAGIGLFLSRTDSPTVVVVPGEGGAGVFVEGGF